MSVLKKILCVIGGILFLGIGYADGVREQLGNDAAVLASYDRMVEALEGKVSQEEMKTIDRAIAFASKMHVGDKRKDKNTVPYLCYPIDVTYDLVAIGGVYDSQALVAAILHDTMRKGDANTLKQIEIEFGSQVAALVKELGEYPVSAKEKKQQDLISHASKEDPVIVEIQLANLLYNLKELKQAPPKGWSKEQKDKYVEWTQTLLKKLPKANPALEQAVADSAQEYWK